MKTKYSDQEIITIVKTGGAELTSVMNYIYNSSGIRDSIIAIIMKYKGTEEDGKDVFQDGIRHFIINVRNDAFEGKSSVKSYIIAICRNIWFRKYSRKEKLEEIKLSFPTSQPMEDSPEVFVFYNEKKEILETHLKNLGEPCASILAMWSLSYSMKEIAEKLDSKSEGYIRKKKHLCFKTLVQTIRGNTALMKKLLE